MQVRILLQQLTTPAAEHPTGALALVRRRGPGWHRTAAPRARGGNRQTRQPEELVPTRACRFDPGRAHSRGGTRRPEGRAASLAGHTPSGRPAGPGHGASASPTGENPTLPRSAGKDPGRPRADHGSEAQRQSSPLVPGVRLLPEALQRWGMVQPVARPALVREIVGSNPASPAHHHLPSRSRRSGICPWYGRGWRFESAQGLSSGCSVNGRTPSCHAGRAGSNPVAHSKPI